MLELDKNTFEAEVLQAPGKILVDFYGDGCVPCAALMPHVHAFAETYGDKIKFCALNTTKARRLAISQKVLNGRGAWRLQGGGFAGTIQAFVPYDLLDSYRTAIDACFGEGSCHVLNIRNYGAVPVTPDM